MYINGPGAERVTRGLCAIATFLLTAIAHAQSAPPLPIQLFGTEAGFGSRLAFGGGHLAVPAQGVIRIFELTESGPESVVEVVLPDAYAELASAPAIAIDERRCLIGIPGDNEGAGSVLVYENTKGQWNYKTKFSPIDGKPGDKFGTALDVSGDRCIVGAIGVDYEDVSDFGAVYVYEDRNGKWTQQANLTLFPQERAFGTRFGECVAIDGDRCAVHVNPNDKFLGMGAMSSVFIFELREKDWVRAAQIQQDPQEWRSTVEPLTLALSGDRIAFVSISWTIQQGVVHVYRKNKNDDSWKFEVDLYADRELFDFYGHSIDMDGDVLVASQVGNAQISPAVYVFKYVVNPNDHAQGGQWRRAYQITTSFADGPIAISDGYIAVGSGFFQMNPVQRVSLWQADWTALEPEATDAFIEVMTRNEVLAALTQSTAKEVELRKLRQTLMQRMRDLAEENPAAPNTEQPAPR